MSSKNKQSPVASFFKNNQGNTVIWQTPNIPLLSWLVLKLLAMVINNEQFKSGFSKLSTAFLFAWAYLEITSGASYFRRLLGLVVMTALIIGFFK